MNTEGPSTLRTRHIQTIGHNWMSGSSIGYWHLLSRATLCTISILALKAYPHMALPNNQITEILLKN